MDTWHAVSVTARNSRKTTRYRLRAVAALSAAVVHPHTNAPPPSATCTLRTQSGSALRSVLSELDSEKDEAGDETEAAAAAEEGSADEAEDARSGPDSGSDAKAAAIPDGDVDEWRACEAAPSASSGRLTDARNPEADGDADAEAAGVSFEANEEKMRLANERHVRNSRARIMQSTAAEHELNKMS